MIHIDKHDLMIGDDSDSSLSCDLLAHITNGKWKPNYFYNFESFYQINKYDLNPSNWL